VGALGAYRLLSRGRRTPAPPAQSIDDPRAAELRRRLDESRALVEEREEFEAGETPVDRAESADDFGERRRRVHDRGRAVVEQMRGGDSDQQPEDR
jgi:hypothetical protein